LSEAEGMVLKMKFEKLKWKEVEEQVKNNNILVLPLGSLEQHGYHLPVDTDVDCANYVAGKVTEKTNTLLLPPIYYGYVEYALDFPGTVSVTNFTLINYLVEIAISLWKTGFKKLLIINGHGGNTAALATALEIISEKTDMLAAGLMWVSMAADDYNKDREVATGYNAHAAEFETDVKYFIDPDNVDKSKAVEEMGGPINKYMYWDLGKGSGPISMLLKWKYYTKSGVLGDATKSTAEKGKKWVNNAIDNTVDFIENIFRKMDFPKE
jgi:creatinine amidohydrolase